MQVTTELVIATLNDVEGIIISRFSRKIAMISKRVDIEDVLQEIRIKAVQSAKDCKAVDADQLRFWVLTIARYTVESMITRERAIKRSTTREECAIGVSTDESRDGYQPAGSEVDPSVKAEVSEVCAIMISMLDSLSPAQATAIRMLYLENASYEEIAAKLGNTVLAARNVVDRGLKSLRAKLSV